MSENFLTSDYHCHFIIVGSKLNNLHFTAYTVYKNIYKKRMADSKEN